MSAPTQRLQIDDGALRTAWQHRHRADWPAGYVATMAHPLYRRIVRAEAVRLALAERRQAADATRFDARRAAAGDFNDG